MRTNTWWEIQPDDDYESCIRKILDCGDLQEPIAQYLAEVLQRFGGAAAVEEAPFDGQLYGRQSGDWEPITTETGVPEAPMDHQLYGRRDAGWQILSQPPPQGWVPEAPVDGNLYGRENGSWRTIPSGGGGGGGGAVALVFGETPVGNIDGVNTNYTTAFAYSPNSLAVFLNGLRQRRASDYTETGNRTFSFLSAPLSGDSLSIDYMQP